MTPAEHIENIRRHAAAIRRQWAIVCDEPSPAADSLDFAAAVLIHIQARRSDPGPVSVGACVWCAASGTVSGPGRIDPCPLCGGTGQMSITTEGGDPR